MKKSIQNALKIITIRGLLIAFLFNYIKIQDKIGSKLFKNLLFDIEEQIENIELRK